MIAIDVVRPAKDNAPTHLVITFDEQGLKSWFAQLRFLMEGSTEHLHLMSPVLGGHDLAGIAFAAGADPIHHVKLVLVNEGNTRAS